MKWIRPIHRNNFTRSTLAHISAVKGGVRISIPREDADNISRSGKVAFGVDGDRLYIADDPKGFKLIERVYRKYVILWNNYEELLPFVGKHPLFIEGSYYIITKDNKE